MFDVTSFPVYRFADSKMDKQVPLKNENFDIKFNGWSEIGLSNIRKSIKNKKISE